MNKQQLDQLEQQVIAKIQEGDIIFISIDNLLYKQVAKGTGSWTSHVGFIVQENDEWFVMESAVPFVTKCPLRKFLSRTTNQEVAIKRLGEGLTQQQVASLKLKASVRDGRWYHLGFNFDSPRQFCSKFVYLTFKEALGVKLGKVQTLKELLSENPETNTTFWRIWYFGFIPWQRRTITPASQLVDDQLITVFDNVA